ncbi:DUF2786 domain-containing protein [Rhodococcus sp. NPDC003994]
MTASTASTSVLDKIRKLFAKADSVAGTPEAEIFNAKAFELLAKYGVDEAEARQQAGDGPAEIVHETMDFAGKHVGVQADLAGCIVRGLGGTAILHGSVLLIFGTAATLERTRILFAMLQPQMLAGGRKVRPGFGDPTGLVAYRRSWMRGFAHRVMKRLEEARGAAQEQASASTALVLRDEARRSEEGLDDFLTSIGARRKQRSARHSAAGAAAGAAAASNVDLGGTAVRGQRALGR